MHTAKQKEPLLFCAWPSLPSSLPSSSSVCFATLSLLHLFPSSRLHHLVLSISFVLSSRPHLKKEDLSLLPCPSILFSFIVRISSESIRNIIRGTRTDSDAILFLFFSFLTLVVLSHFKKRKSSLWPLEVLLFGYTHLARSMIRWRQGTYDEKCGSGDIDTATIFFFELMKVSSAEGGGGQFFILFYLFLSPSPYGSFAAQKQLGTFFVVRRRTKKQNLVPT